MCLGGCEEHVVFSFLKYQFAYLILHNHCSIRYRTARRLRTRSVESEVLSWSFLLPGCSCVNIRIIFANDRPGRQINKPIDCTSAYSRQNAYTNDLKYLSASYTPNSFTVCASDTLHLVGQIRRMRDECDMQYGRAWREMRTECWWKNLRER